MELIGIFLTQLYKLRFSASTTKATTWRPVLGNYRGKVWNYRHQNLRLNLNNITNISRNIAVSKYVLFKGAKVYDYCDSKPETLL